MIEEGEIYGVHYVNRLDENGDELQVDVEPVHKVSINFLGDDVILRAPHAVAVELEFDHARRIALAILAATEQDT